MFLIHYIEIHKSYFALATFQVLFSGHMWLVATVLDNIDKDYFCHHRKLYWTELFFYSVKKVNSKVLAHFCNSFYGSLLIPEDKADDQS